MASVMTWPASVPAITTAGDQTVRMHVCAKKASVIKKQANAHVTPASGVLSVTTSATAASTPSATPWRAAASAGLDGWGETALCSVTVTTRHVNSSRDAVSVLRCGGGSGASGTASVHTANATKLMALVSALQATVGSSAENRVRLDSTDRTAGTSRIFLQSFQNEGSRYGVGFWLVH